MEKMDYWRLRDQFSVVEAALLIIGVEDPGAYENLLSIGEQERPENFSNVFTGLLRAIKGGRLEAEIRHNDDDYWDETMAMDDINWELTTVLLEDLRDWLTSRGFKTGFFFPEENVSPDYLDANHEHYAPKLAAAINAWQTVNKEPGLLVGKTVKQALTIWLRKNAGQYGLTKDDGNPNEQGIDEIAKISNWDFKGGAPKTPG